MAAEEQSDDFSSDTFASYTSNGDAPASWSISGGQLLGSGGSQAMLTRNDLSASDMRATVHLSGAQDAGVVARWKDNGNYYLASIHDESAVTTVPNRVQLYKRVAGNYTKLGGDGLISFVRGTEHQLSLEVKGSSIVASFDGVPLISVMDDGVSGPGTAGPRVANGSGYTAFITVEKFSWLAFPAHRYWRLSEMKTGDGTIFTMNEIQFWLGASRQDIGASISSNKSFLQGSAGGLGNGVLDEENISFAAGATLGTITWDLQTAKSVDTIKLAHSSGNPQRGLREFKLESSDDGAVWTTANVFTGILPLTENGDTLNSYAIPEPVEPAGPVALAILHGNEDYFPVRPAKLINYALDGPTFSNIGNGPQPGGRYWFPGSDPIYPFGEGISMATEDDQTCAIVSDASVSLVGALCHEIWLDRLDDSHRVVWSMGTTGQEDGTQFLSVRGRPQEGGLWIFDLFLQLAGPGSGESILVTPAFSFPEGVSPRHVATIRDAAGFWKMSLDGVLLATSAAPHPATLTGYLSIFGLYDQGNGGTDGVFRASTGEMRVTTGGPVYSTFPFTPPTERFPNPSITGFVGAQTLQGVSQVATGLVSMPSANEVRDFVLSKVNLNGSSPSIPLMAAPPAVTWGEAGSSPSLPGAPENFKRFWWGGEGGQPGVGGGMTAFDAFDNFRTEGTEAIFGGAATFSAGGSSTQYFAQGVGFGEGSADGSPYYIAFTHTGRSFALAGRNYNQFSLRINGERTALIDPTGHDDQYCYLDFGTVATRNIILNLTADAAFAELVFGSTDTVVPYTAWRQDALHDSFIGDSYFQGSMYAQNSGSFCEGISYSNGGTLVSNTAEGGTGYSSNNSTEVLKTFNWPGRINALVTGRPHRTWVAGGINDGWPTSANTGTSIPNVDTASAISDFYDTLEERNPTTFLHVLGPWCPRGDWAVDVNGTFPAIRNAIKAKVETTGFHWVFFDNLAGTWSTSWGTSRATAEGPWVTGTGSEAAPTGDGNADIYISDGTHPTDAGQLHLVSKIAQYTREAYATLGAAQLVGTQTTANVSQTATGKALVKASVTQTTAGVSQTAAGSALVKAAAAQTTASVVQAATAKVIAKASAAQTLAPVTQTATAVSVPFKFAATQTLAGVSQTATAKALARATASQTLGNVTQVATGTVQAMPGYSAGQTTAGVTQTATAKALISHSGAQTLEGVTQSATGKLVGKASATQTTGSVEQSATAQALIKAQATQTLANVVATATAQTLATLAGGQTLDGVSQQAQAVVLALEVIRITGSQVLANVTQLAFMRGAYVYHESVRTWKVSAQDRAYSIAGQDRYSVLAPSIRKYLIT